jgi:hypothetical protein
MTRDILFTDAMAALMAMSRSEHSLRLEALATRLDRLARRLTKFSFPAIAQPLAGLLTFPENHTATLRIEALIHLAALTCHGRATPTLAQLREWLNEIIFKDLVTQLEDPVEDVFVSNVPTWFGNARLFDGGWGDNDFYLQSCLTALSRMEGRPWVDEAQRCIIALLRLAETMAARAGVPRFTLTDTPPRRPLRVAASVVRAGRGHVTFTLRDVLELGVHPVDLDPFVFAPEHATRLASETLGHTTLERRPLVKTSGQLIMALPTAIGVAARRYILDCAIASGDLRFLERTIAESQFRDVFHIGRVAWEIDCLEEPTHHKTLNLHEFVGLFDEGGYAHLIVVPDSLEETAQEGLQGTHSLSHVLDEHINARTMALAERSDYRRGLTLLVHGGIGRGFAVGFGKAPPGWQRLGLCMPDFMRLGWDHDATALRAWKLLDQEDAPRDRGITLSNINGFMNLYGYVHHQDFKLVPDEIASGFVGLATDFLTPLRHRLRTTLDQHVALAPDRQSWVEVQRQTTSVFFQESRDLPVYVSPGHAAGGVLLSCVETAARPWWIACHELPDDERHRSIAHQVWKMARDWLVRIVPVLERHLSHTPPGPVSLHLSFPGIESYSHEAAVVGVLTTPPRVEILDGKAFIECPPTYLRTFADAKNIGDRYMVAAIIRAIYALSGTSIDDALVMDLVQAIVRDDEARFLHMIPASTFGEMMHSALSLPRPRLLTPEDRAWSGLDLARVCGWTEPPGPVPADKAAPLLNRAVAVLWERLREQLAGLERSSVIERALLNHDAIGKDLREWRLTAAALLALHDDKSDVVQAASNREGHRGLAGLTSRVIAEMALCTSPLGVGSTCAKADLDRLIADTATLLECAGQSDALHYELATHDLVVHPNGSLGFDTTFAETLHQPYMQAHGERGFRAAATDYGDPFEIRAAGDDSVDAAFDAVFCKEFGLGLQELFDFAANLAKEALSRRMSQFRLPRSEVTDRLAAIGAIDPEFVFKALALVPRKRWDEHHPSNAEARDWYPWRYNRRLSLTRRPLIQLSNRADTEVLIVPTLIEGAIRYLCEAFPGRLPIELFDSAAMREWIGGAANRDGHRFNQTVADRLRALGYRVVSELKMTVFGGKMQLGDVDVLAWRPETGVVHAIECKRLLFARTVGEIGERLREYTTIAEPGSDRTPVQKHLDRITFLRSATAPLATLTGIARDSLKLRSALVTDYIVPMQFSKEALRLMDTVTDFALLHEAFR